GGFGGKPQTGMSVSQSILANMFGQLAMAPDFSSVAVVFGLGAGQAHYPSLGFSRDDGFFRTVMFITEGSLRSHRQGTVDPFVNRHSTDAQSMGDCGDVLTRRITEEDLGTLHLALWPRAGLGGLF